MSEVPEAIRALEEDLRRRKEALVMSGGALDTKAWKTMYQLRKDSIPALDLWDLIVSVLGNTTQNHDRTGRPVVNTSGNLFSTSHDSQT